MENVHINNLLKQAKKQGINKWQVADKVGISDTTFSKWLRKELTPERQVQILAAIEKINIERGGI